MSKIYGYCRISRPQQSIDRQVRNIQSDYPTAIILKEAYTGRQIDRPEWKKLSRQLKKGDTIIFDSVSRMSRNADDGVKTYFELYDKGINLVFLKEHHIDTDTYKESINQVVELTGNEIADCYIEATNKVFKILAERQIKLAFEQAQKEVDDIRQRTREGIETARLNGKQIGQRKSNTLNVKKAEPIKKLILELSKDFKGHNNDKEVMAILSTKEIEIKNERGQVERKSAKVSRNTYYRYKAELIHNNN